MAGRGTSVVAPVVGTEVDGISLFGEEAGGNEGATVPRTPAVGVSLVGTVSTTGLPEVKVGELVSGPAGGDVAPEGCGEPATPVGGSVSETAGIDGAPVGAVVDTPLVGASDGAVVANGSALLDGCSCEGGAVIDPTLSSTGGITKPPPLPTGATEGRATFPFPDASKLGCEVTTTCEGGAVIAPRFGSTGGFGCWATADSPGRSTSSRTSSAIDGASTNTKLL